MLTGGFKFDKIKPTKLVGYNISKYENFKKSRVWADRNGALGQKPTCAGRQK